VTDEYVSEQFRNTVADIARNLAPKQPWPKCPHINLKPPNRSASRKTLTIAVE